MAVLKDVPAASWKVELAFLARIESCELRGGTTERFNSEWEKLGARGVEVEEDPCIC